MDGSVATVSDTGKKRFADLVRLHAQKAKFITREQEIKLLEEGLNRYDMSLQAPQPHPQGRVRTGRRLLSPAGRELAERDRDPPAREDDHGEPRLEAQARGRAGTLPPLVPVDQDRLTLVSGRVRDDRGAGGTVGTAAPPPPPARS